MFLQVQPESTCKAEPDLCTNAALAIRPVVDKSRNLNLVDRDESHSGHARSHGIPDSPEDRPAHVAPVEALKYE